MLGRLILLTKGCGLAGPSLGGNGFGEVRSILVLPPRGGTTSPALVPPGRLLSPQIVAALGGWGWWGRPALGSQNGLLFTGKVYVKQTCSWTQIAISKGSVHSMASVCELGCACWYPFISILPDSRRANETQASSHVPRSLGGRGSGLGTASPWSAHRVVGKKGVRVPGTRVERPDGGTEGHSPGEPCGT